MDIINRIKKIKPFNLFSGILPKAKEKIELTFMKDIDAGIVEAAVRVYACANWVFKRGQDASVDKEKEVQDFLTAEQELREKMQKLPLKEILEDLVETQQDLLDYFSPDTKEHNKFNARRYIGFIIANELLRNCNKEICPDKALKEEYVEYMQRLTIEEFVRYKAYLRWKERTKDKYIKDDHKELEDYLTGMGFLDTTMNNCKNQKCKDIVGFWQKIVERKLKSQENILETIKRAKKNTLKRILPVVYASHNIYVEEFVDRFYNHILKLSSLNQPSQDIAAKIVNSIYENPQVINMFEFLLKCLLVTRLSREEHNSIRVICKKDPLEAIAT